MMPLSDRKIIIERCDNGWLIEYTEWDKEKMIWASVKPREVYQDSVVLMEVIKEWVGIGVRRDP